MGDQVKIEEPEEQVPHGTGHSDRPINYQEKCIQMTNAFNNAARENQDIRVQLRTMERKHELESANSQLKCNYLQAQIDTLMKMMWQDGRLNSQQDTAQYPNHSFQNLTPIDQPMHQKPLQNPLILSSPDIQIITPDESRRRKKKRKAILMLQEPLESPKLEPNPEVFQKSMRHTEKADCIFCDLGKHSYNACSLYKYPAERIEIAQRRRLCLKCHEPTSKTKRHDCLKISRNCRICRSYDHSAMFCVQPVDATKRYCEFCSNQHHDSKECTIYFVDKSVRRRKRKMAKENRCERCLKPNDAEGKHTKCRNISHYCQLCFPHHNEREAAAHHPLLCEYYYGKLQIQKDKSSRSDPN